MYLLLFFIVPIGASFIARYKLRDSYNWKEFCVSLGITGLLVTVVYFLGQYQSLQDMEIWNGKIVSKHRDHGHYVRTYSCNCYQSCSGSGESRTCTEVCQTCYEDRYTVNWYAKSTIGNITFQSLDRSSRSVYSEPDPAVYKKCIDGEPASLEKSYTNYVKAVPDSLFNTEQDNLVYADKIPAYPGVYSFYKINRVINIDSKISADQIKQLDDKLSKALITLGPAKQVNIIVILTEIDDSGYRYEVENAWVGGKKNDVVLFLGLDGDRLTWVDVMTWALNSGNELFQATLRQSVREIANFDADSLSADIVEKINTLYDRPHMADFEYLKDDIDPPTWLLIVCFVLSLGSTGATIFYFHKTDL